MRRMTLKQRALHDRAQRMLGYQPRWWSDKNEFARKRQAQHDALLTGKCESCRRMPWLYAKKRPR